MKLLSIEGGRRHISEELPDSIANMVDVFKIPLKIFDNTEAPKLVRSGLRKCSPPGRLKRHTGSISDNNRLHFDEETRKFTSKKASLSSSSPAQELIRFYRSNRGKELKDIVKEEVLKQVLDSLEDSDLAQVAQEVTHKVLTALFETPPGTGNDPHSAAAAIRA